uniref:Amoebapore-like protein n=1 Tax=Fasciola hepatica TaxID=6192 RepID=A0A385MCD7_FASHE|nr:amoebapore-like protein [Fasciola hepatica]
MNPLFVLMLAAVTFASFDAPSKQPTIDIDLCDICTNTMDVIKKMLADQTVEEHIGYLVKYLCKIARSQDACIEFVQQEVDYIIDHVEQHNATEICRLIKLC